MEVVTVYFNSDENSVLVNTPYFFYLKDMEPMSRYPRVQIRL
jgi:hypothetical protein